MRTDISPIFLDKATGSSKSTSEIGLTNQLLEVDTARPAFDRVLAQQSRKSAFDRDHAGRVNQSRQEEQQRQRASSEARSDRESGKPLPSDRSDRLEAQQSKNARMEKHRQQADRAEGDRSEGQRSIDDRQQAQFDKDQLLEGQTHKQRIAHCRVEESAQQMETSKQGESSAGDSDQVFIDQMALNKPAVEDIVSNDEVVDPIEVDHIRVSEDLLDKAKHAVAEQPIELSSEPSLAESLTDEERNLLQEQMVQPNDIEGQGFAEAPDIELNPQLETQANTGVANTAGLFQPTTLASAESDTLKQEPVSPAGSQFQQINTKQSPSENSAIQQTLDAAEPESWELGKDKKGELGVVSGKPFIKTPGPEANTLTPVQERLAALARSLEQPVNQRESRRSTVLSGIDGIKSAAPQKGGEPLTQQSQAPGQRLLNSAVQTPLQPGLQNAMANREWASELGQRLMMMVSSKIQSAKIQLNPREMGPIDIKVVMQQEQANVVFSSQITQTREALEQAIPRLREMFEQSGVSLADVDVRDQDAQQSKQRDQHQSHDGKTWDGEVTAEEESSTVVSAQPVGLVDYYA